MSPPPFHVLTPDAQYADDGTVERRTAGDHVAWEIRRERDAARIPAESWARADALLVWHEVKIDADLIARLENCRIIVRAGVGFDHIDLAAADRAGIPVCNTPDYGTAEVADHAMALMLAFKRGIPAFHDRLRADPVGGFDAAAVPQVARLRGRRIAIVGLGRIGTATALRAKAFGMTVVGYDPYLPRGQEIALGIERVETLEAALDRADVVSLHTPLTSETRGLIGARAFGLMAPEAVLINTARGAVVDLDALWEALRMDEIAAAGLDVLPEEPPPADHPLIRAYAAQEAWLRDRLILTPHAAWISAASREDARRLSTETLVQFLVDGRLRNCVNDAWLRR
ncbi:MAG: C-terminal binding protein [Alphaproteobacteria bacterium]|nr:C-terminal binding protein [Alphaproteobacteria bacterium]